MVKFRFTKYAFRNSGQGRHIYGKEKKKAAKNSDLLEYKAKLLRQCAAFLALQ